GAACGPSPPTAVAVPAPGTRHPSHDMTATPGMGFVPVPAGAAHLTTAPPMPALAATPVGAPGVPAGGGDGGRRDPSASRAIANIQPMVVLPLPRSTRQ